MNNENTQNNNSQLDNARKGIVDGLVDQYGIDGEKILFLNKNNLLEPWIPPAELKAFARRHGGFKRLDTKFDKFIPETNQVVCVAELVDKDGVEYSNFGVATKDEGRELGNESLAELLASGRAVSATLADAGFHPLKSNSVVNSEQSNQIENMKVTDFASAAVKRNRDIRRIHALAYECGLIMRDENGENKSRYRQWLFNNFPAFFDSVEDASSGKLTILERQQVINKLQIASEVQGMREAA